MYAQPGYNPPQYHQPPPPQPQPAHGPIVNQPQSNAVTNVVVNTGQQQQLKRDWSTQLCGCFEDLPGCCLAWFCPGCFYCYLSSRMQEFFLLPVFVPQGLLALRVKLRSENKIKGSICRDCVCTTCCPEFVMCQMKRELDNVAKKKVALL